LSDAQTDWTERAIAQRLLVLKAARHRMAEMTGEFGAAISRELHRTAADTLVAEVLPLLAAGRFLEQQAEQILRPRRLGITGRPAWLFGVDAEVHRVPYGRVLVIGPANYPLLLPGVQTLQGLTAGNAVIWKPGRDGRPVAELFANAMYASGLPRQLLRITDESVGAAEHEISCGVDKVFFTGSGSSGRLVMKRLADTLTPCVAELSGCDAVIVLPSARLERVVQALAFGMRLNGSATCMAPRRVLLVDCTAGRQREFITMLQEELRQIKGVKLPQSVRYQVRDLLEEARSVGATILSDDDKQLFKPTLIVNGSTDMDVASADVFAPILVVIAVNGEGGALAAQEACPYGLTTSIFGDEAAARRLASKLSTGTVIVNDLVVPTADPRVPFGGRRLSGFGVTRGAEGLLEMTTVKTVTVRHGRSTKHYEATDIRHQSLFRGLILASHAATWRKRWRGVREMIAAGRELKNDQNRR
jgi:aldehyde dehydrogenase (NAD+)